MIIISIIASILNLFSLILIIRSVLTWFPQVDHSNPIVKFIFQITEPILEPVRRVLPPYNGIDFSSMVVLIGIYILTRVLWGLV
jgi:YggT family protein